MGRKFEIVLEDELFHQLEDLCRNNKIATQDFIVQTLKEKLNQDNGKQSPKEKDCLEGYLKKGSSGSRNYGVKGQGW